MSWNLYEQKVHEKFRRLYPDSKVEYNARLKGRISQRSRQVDSLITTTINGIEYRTVVEARYFNKRIGIKIVESFLGFLNDAGVDKGVIVTNEGFTAPAKSRIDNDKSDVELKILTMEELPAYIAFYCVVTYGPVEFALDSHPKWLINARFPTRDAIAKIYPKKYDWKKATSKKEYIYATIALHIDENHKLIKGYKFDDMVQGLANGLYRKHGHPKSLKVHSRSFVEVDGAPTMMLVAEMEKYSEYLAIIDYEEYTVLIGLVTPNKLKDQNLEVLGYFVSQVKPVFSTQPGIPNLSQFYIPYNEENWWHPGMPEYGRE